MIGNWNGRRTVNHVMFAISGACAITAVGVLVFILGYLTWQGGSALRWSFFTMASAPPGEGGGIAHAIAGSSLILMLSALGGIPIAFAAALYLAEFGGETTTSMVRYSLDVLNGVPSIVLGIFVYLVVVVPIHHFSAVAGACALSLIFIPVSVRAAEQALRAVPGTLREGALALGVSRWKAVMTVVVPAALPGILTAILLSMARIAGETAPLLFTSLNSQFHNSGWDQPTASLPVVIFTYAISPYEEWRRQAWAAALVLLFLVLLVNAVCRVTASGRVFQGRNHI